MKIKEPEHGYFNDDICDYLEENSKLDVLIENDKKDSIIGFIGGPPCPDFSTAGKNKGIKATMVSYQKHILNSFAKKNPIFLFLKM